MGGSGVFAEIVDGDVYKYYSDGEWRTSSSGKSVAIINPTTRETQYKVQASTQEEVNKVMDSAKSAQKSWAKTPLWKRAELLHKAAGTLKQHKDPIAECLIKEIAEPAKDSVTEVVRSGHLVSYCAEEGVRILGEGKLLVSDSFPRNERTKYCLTSKIPLGVVLAIPPFNYPVNLAVSKISPALIAGNSLVLKPPTQGCVFTKDVNKAILISDAMETGTVQINSAPARGPDHFPFQGIKDSGIGSQGITNSIEIMTKVKTTVINLPTPSYSVG